MIHGTLRSLPIVRKAASISQKLMFKSCTDWQHLQGWIGRWPDLLGFVEATGHRVEKREVESWGHFHLHL